MLNKVLSLTALASTPKNSQKEFNASLPLLLKVISKLKGNNYLLELGNVKIQTKSQKELQVGAKYFASMNRGMAGNIILSRLRAEPKILEKLDSLPLKFTLESLSEILNPSKNTFKDFKDFLLQKLSTSQSREEFLGFAYLFASLQKNVLTIPFFHEGKNKLIQIRKKDKKTLEFYAVFGNLAVLEGSIFDSLDGLVLNIGTLYPQSRDILQNNTKSITIFSEINIYMCENIEPMYEFQDSLLDLRI